MSAPAAGAEDAKLLTLARSAAGRSGGQAGAAVRDEIGRTYLSGPVNLSALRLSALQAAVAAAVSSGVNRFEAVALVGGDTLSAEEEQLLAEVGSPLVLRG